MNKMTDQQKTKYLRSALGMCGVAVNEYMSEMVWRMYEKIQEKGGQFDLRDASNIEAYMNKKFDVKQKETVQEEILDELKATPKHNSVASVMEAYIDKFWSNKVGRPSVDDVIKKKKINNRYVELNNCIGAISALRRMYKNNQNWTGDFISEEHLISFIENELSATKQETTSQSKA